MTSVRETFADGSTLLQFERALRNCKSRRELYFVGVNEPYSLVAYDQAVLWVGNAFAKTQIVAVSGLAALEGSTPFIQWLTRVFRYLVRENGTTGLKEITPETLPEELVEEGAEWMPGYALHGILRSPKGEVIGGLWLTRNTPFDEREHALATWCTDALSFALWGWQPKRATLNKLFSHRMAAVRTAVIVAALGGISLIPIRLSVLAPAEVTPLKPTPVTAPVDGVVERILVAPSQPVEPGQLLVKLDDTTTRNRLEVARKSREIAVADWQRTSTKAFTDDQSKAELLLLEARVREREAEIVYLQEMLGRLNVLAPRKGVAIFSDPNDWIGKPVQTGERIMMLAEPAEANLTIFLSPDDAIQLAEGGEVHMYLNAAPLESYMARITQMSYEVGQSPEGQPVYIIKAAFDAAQEIPRVGSKGTAKLYAESVPLFYYVFRKPIAYLRKVFGL
ncbi:MAG: efflux RND transporter periplasmic adaptor subunit [Rhodospirillaceae bacterium]